MHSSHQGNRVRATAKAPSPPTPHVATIIITEATGRNRGWRCGTPDACALLWMPTELPRGNSTPRCAPKGQVMFTEASQARAKRGNGPNAHNK